ncbi:structural maintenance of chromosomes protein 6-like [Dendropsophus ebraccatus]|uniref:structural maintenance of chromosomes protein 6-like n=1 Tax=Dendropsophus ebraccatus TaxID=150705 RepID=UPI0038312FB5
MDKRKVSSPLNTGRHSKNAGADEEEEQDTSTSFINGGSQSDTAEVGIIESIYLKNFMCHGMLGPFNFGPNINFVVGNNGSGKSAVLTALIVGLGGKAALTNRGTSIKGFVKDGQTSADIIIRLRNSGEGAYRPEVYGDSIVLQHRLTMDGGRRINIKSSSGSLISSKKEELISILDHFNIQVDNPLCVLTQDMSKQLLHNKNEGDNYNFFMKATLLEQMKNDYSYIMETKTRTSDQISFGQERLHELKQYCMEKEEKFKSLASLSEMKLRLEELKKKMAWALVNEAEKQIIPFREQLAADEGRVIKFEQKIIKWQDKVKNAHESFRTLKDKLEEITRDAEALKPLCIALKDGMQQRKHFFHESEVLYNRFRMERRRLERDAEQLNRRIQELQNSGDNVSEEKKITRLDEINQLKDHIKALHDQDITTSERINQFQEALYRDKEERNKIVNAEFEQKQKVEALKRQIKELQESKTDRLKRFGQHIPALLAEIDEAYRQRRFRVKPVGPLGSLIYLKDPQLALATESCLKYLLQAFCCNNHQDERTLQGLMAKVLPHGYRPQIIVSQFQDEMYNVSQRAVVHPDYPSVLTALEIDNPVVANCLIDMRGIETVLLIKNNSEARKVMQKRSPPQNCREAFTADGDQVFQNRYYSSEFNRARYLSSDVEGEITHLEREVNDTVSQFSSIQQQLHSIDFGIRKNEVLLRQHNETKKRIQVQIREANARLTELENVEEQPSIDISTLESEVQENKKRIEHVKEKMEKAKLEMEENKPLFLESERQYEDMKSRINSVTDIAEPLKEDLNKVDQEVEDCKHQLKHYEDKLKEHLNGIKNRKDALNAKEKDLEENIAKAKQIYPERMEVSRTARSLDTEINHLREKINSEHHLHGNREDIIKEYQAAKENYQDMESKIKNLKVFLELLGHIMSQRYKMYQQFRRYLTLRCKFYFDSLLAQRAYSGKISFDHKNEKLSIAVELGEGNKAAMSDMRSLSGGERSFSTVCFVLSLWSISESPFRCVDEFDVYMDMVNRRISMDMMLTMADSQRFRQFIVLTPQQISSLPSSNFIRILRMQDPDRGQTTLSFRPVDQEEEDD